MTFLEERTWVTAETVTAAIFNAHIKGNIGEMWNGQVAGDMEYYSSVSSMSRIPMGEPYSVMSYDTEGGMSFRNNGLALVENEVLGVAASELTLATILAGYGKITRIVAGFRSDTDAEIDTLQMKINNDGGGNYDYNFRYIYGDNVGAPVFDDAANLIKLGLVPGNTASAGRYAMLEMYLNEYDNTNFWKNFMGRIACPVGSGSEDLYSQWFFCSWRSTAAITEIDFSLLSGDDISINSYAKLIGQR